MKKKIYTMVLATLGLFASVDVGAQTWEWTPEKVGDANFYIMHESGKFLANASADVKNIEDVTSDDVFTLKNGTYWVTIVVVPVSTKGYSVKNHSGSYLYLADAWPTYFNATSNNAVGLKFDENNGGYNINYDGKQWLYLDGNIITNNNEDKAKQYSWRLITPAQMSVYADFPAFKTALNDEKAEPLWPRFKYNEDDVTEKVYNKDNFAAVKDIPAAYLAALEAIEIEMPTEYTESQAYQDLAAAIASAKTKLDAAIAGDLSSMATAIEDAKTKAANAKAVYDAVAEAMDKVNAENDYRETAASAALAALVGPANEALNAATSEAEVTEALADYNAALAFVETVETAYTYVNTAKEGVQSDNAETAAYAALTTALADAETALAAAENADDVDAAKAIMDNAVQFVGTVDTALSSLPAGQQSGQDSDFAGAYAAAFNTLGAALTTAQGAISAATDVKTVNDAKSAYTAAYDLYQTKSNQFRGVEEIAEQFADSETLMNLAAEAMNTVAAATSDSEAMTAIPELTENVTTVYTAGNIDDSKAAEGSDVDINDYAELASIILKATYTRQQKPELSETPDMAERLAVRKYNLCDANEDNKVNVADLTKIVIIIKGQTQSFAKGMNAISGTISTVAAGNDLIFSLANTGVMTGMQLDVTLPAGISIMDQALSGRAANHSIEVNNIGGNTYRVLINGFDNAAFADNSGEMFRLSLTGNATEVAVSEAYASDANANSYDLQVAGNSTTGINTVEAQQADAVAIYSIGGKQLNGISKGVNILVGADGKANKVLK